MYPNIIRKVFSEPWLLLPSAHQTIQQTLIEAIHNKLDSRMPLTRENPFTGKEEKIQYYENIGNGVARVKLYGIVGKHLSSLEMMCGGCSLDFALKGLTEADKDPSIKKIILDISSPGGTATGVTEFASMVRRISETTPVFAFTETLCCSAAMWIASACKAIISTPSAIIGSIGVYRAWYDDTEKNKKEGLELILFEAGEHKAIGLRPPTNEEREMIQKGVEKLHEEFKAAIRMGRPSVSDDVMEGQTYSGVEASQNGLSDALVLCFDDALKLI